jgi:transposase
MTVRVRDAIPSSPPRRKLGWWHWRAARPRSWVIPTSCGPPGCSLRMPGNTDRPPASEPGEAGPGDSVQDLGRARSQAAQEPALAKAGVRYYLEQRDPEFEPKMAEILCVYRQVAMLRGQAVRGQDSGGGAGLAIVSYDEIPGIQAIGTTAPDRPPLPGTSPTVMRDHEYKRHGTLTLMAGIDLLTGHVHALVKERHRSREFIEFLKLLDAAYPADTAIEVILDNHSAHVSRETMSWLAAQPIGRFTFTFTPTHGSWLNLIEGFFSKLARSVLRHIRVSSKHELKERLIAFIGDINREPVVHTWRYKIDTAA